MQTYLCGKCQKEFNVALGTFGFGMPNKCECGSKDFIFLGNGWNADADPLFRIVVTVKKIDDMEGHVSATIISPHGALNVIDKKEVILENVANLLNEFTKKYDASKRNN